MKFWKYVKDIEKSKSQEQIGENEAFHDMSEQSGGQEQSNDDKSSQDMSEQSGGQQQSSETSQDMSEQSGGQGQSNDDKSSQDISEQSGRQGQSNDDKSSQDMSEQSGGQGQSNDDKSSQDMSEQSEGQEQSNDDKSSQDMSEQSGGQGQSNDDKSSQDMSEQPQVQNNDKKNHRDMSEQSGEQFLNERKEKLNQLKEKLRDYAEMKKKHENQDSLKKSKSHLHASKQEQCESIEEKYKLSEQTNQFLNQLNELPSFKDIDRGAGYAIDTEGYTELPDSMIRTLITKFLNQRFCKKNTDLNLRSNSIEKSKGFHKWEIKDVITHLETNQITKIFDDKYGYEYSNGKNENVPLSFYFDMSGSMSEYTNLLAVIAIELLKKDVKVLIGFNERVNVQIESINKNINVAKLAEILENAGYGSWGKNIAQDKLKKSSEVVFKYIDKNIDNYLLEKKAEKCVVFADFDPLDEVVNLSQNTQVYWFCFESNFDKEALKKYNGFIYKVENAKDIVSGLIKVNEKRFETLMYVDNPKKLQKKIGGKFYDNY